MYVAKSNCNCPLIVSVTNPQQRKKEVVNFLHMVDIDQHLSCYETTNLMNILLRLFI